MIKVLFVCHGNICRSTMAEFVMKELVRQRGIADLFYIASAATSREEIGNDTHWGTKEKLREQGIPFTKRKAVQITKADYEAYDYIARPCRLPRPITRRTIILSALTGKTIMKFAAFAGQTMTAKYTLSCPLPVLTAKWPIRGIRGISIRPMKMSIWAAGRY